MTANTKWFDRHGVCVRDVPAACVTDCSAPGERDDVVKHWIRTLDFNVPREHAMEYLRAFGAWDDDELTTMTDLDLASIVLWLACCEINENGSWLGLIH